MAHGYIGGLGAAVAIGWKADIERASPKRRVTLLRPRAFVRVAPLELVTPRADVAVSLIGQEPIVFCQIVLS